MTPLLLDQGLPVGAARLLRERGWDVVHVSERGLSRASDADLLLLAAEEHRVAVTLDADFPMLVTLERRNQPSVIHLRLQPLDLRRCAAVLEEIVPSLLAELQAGAIVSVRESGTRVRRLPVDRGAR